MRLLQGIGRLSMSVAAAVAVAADQTPGLAERLAGPADILDVGTGVGWLAVALARAYADARIVGIDIFEPALELARANVTTERLDGGIELRRQDVLTLAPDPAFDVVWLPLPFLPEAIVPDALRSVHAGLKPGAGWWPGPLPAAAPICSRGC